MRVHNFQWLQTNEHVQYYEQMQKYGVNLSTTNVSAGLGQVNSAYNDSKLGISQALKFPTVYKRERSVVNANWQIAKADKAVTEAKLIQRLSELYANLQMIHQKDKLLMYSKQLMSQFAEKARLRYQQGAANVAEQMTAQNQLIQISVQYDQLKAEQAALLKDFNQMLGEFNTFTVLPDDRLMLLNRLEVQMEQHSTINLAQEQYMLAQKQALLSKTYWMPELSVGMFNQSFAGWQKIDNAEKFYTRSNRFNSVQLSLGLPLFSRSAAASAKAQQWLTKEALWAYQAAILQHQSETYNAELQYEVAKQAYNTYLTSLLSNADTLLKAADRQYAAGELDFISYVQLLHQGIQYKSAFLEAQWALNKAIIHLNYLNRK
jgi:cobalt-zinc-cadmium resistance protein CzcA